MTTITTTRVGARLLATQGPKTGEWTWGTCPDCRQVLTIDGHVGGGEYSGWRAFNGPSCHREDGSLNTCQNQETS
jgi:hypothetical protein